MNRYYYTLTETLLPTLSPAKKPNYAKTANMGMANYINMLLGTDVVEESDISKTLMTDYIWPECYNSFVLYIDTTGDKPEVSSDEFIDAKTEYIGRVWAWFNKTRFRYEELIKLYQSQISELMGQIKSTNISKFNDTPQASDGPFDQDKYTSNVTINETASDGATAMARLAEIRSNLWSIFAEWADEFRMFIIED